MDTYLTAHLSLQQTGASMTRKPRATSTRSGTMDRCGIYPLLDILGTLRMPLIRQYVLKELPYTQHPGSLTLPLCTTVQHLFTTKRLVGAFKWYSLQPVLDPDEVKHFNGTTVPFAFVDNKQLYLVAQRQFNGRRTPMISRYTSAKKWTGWQPIVNLPPSIQACTSPIVAPSPDGGWVMMCIEEKRR